MSGYKMKVRLKKRSQVEWLIWILIIAPFLFGVINELLGLPRATRYIIDISWGLLIVLWIKFIHKLNYNKIKTLICWVSLFFAYAILVYMVRYQSVFYFFWGWRNNFRFYIAFILFSSFLFTKDIEDYFNLFKKLFWLNSVISIIQFLKFGLKGDNLGGLFGTEVGVNAYTNVFFVIVVSWSALNYLENKESVWPCVARCMTALFIAALAELKFFFVECVVILIISVFITKFSWKKLLFVLVGFIGISIGTAIVASLFPHFSDFFSIEWFVQTSTSSQGYTYSGDLNRLNAIPMINDLWLTDTYDQLFGLGLGNCDSANYAIVTTPFHIEYSDLHYTWLSYAFMYLECGWIGLIFYFGFFVLVYIKVRKIEKRSSGDGVTYCRLARIMAIMCMIISIYNASLRTEAGYMAYFVLAIPFVFDRQAKLGAMCRKEVAA